MLKTEEKGAKPVTADTLSALRLFSHPLFSPDGRYLAGIRQRADVEANCYQGGVFLYDIQSGATVQAMEGARDFVWTAEGTLLCTRGPKAGETVIEEILPDGPGLKGRFTLPLEVKQLCAVCGGSLLLTAVEALCGGAQGDYQVIDELPFWSNGRGITNGLRTRLYAFDLGTGALTRVCAEDAEVGSLSVRENRVLYKAYPWRNLRGTYEGIYLYDVLTGENRCLLPAGVRRTGLIGLWAEREAVVASAEDHVYADGQYMDFYALDLETGGMRRLAEYDDPSGEGLIASDARYGAGQTVKAAEDLCYFTTMRRGSVYLSAIHRDGRIEDIVTEEGCCDSFDVHDGHVAVCGFYAGLPAEIYLDGRNITHGFDREAWRLSVPEPVRMTASDGYEICGWVMPPAECEPGRTYPAILHIHGGPHAAFGAIFHHEMQVWANAGYFVFFANPRGSSGYGAEFADVSGRMGDIDYKNLMEFTDEVLRRYPMIDAERLGVTGASYGGYMTNWICGHTDRFRAAVAQCSIASWISIEHMSDIGYTFNKDNVSALTREDADRVWAQSPLKYAAACRTPTLFIHGDEDYRTPLAEGIQMFTALKLTGTQARLCIFHGENHGLSRNGKPKNRLLRMKEILRWMDDHLKGGQT